MGTAINFLCFVLVLFYEVLYVMLYAERHVTGGKFRCSSLQRTNCSQTFGECRRFLRIPGKQSEQGLQVTHPKWVLPQSLPGSCPVPLVLFCPKETGAPGNFLEDVFLVQLFAVGTLSECLIVVGIARAGSPVGPN